MTGARSAPGGYFPLGSGPVLLGVDCNGTEDKITQCTYQEQECSHSEDAGVTCEGELHTHVYISERAVSHIQQCVWPSFLTLTATFDFTFFL